MIYKLRNHLKVSVDNFYKTLKYQCIDSFTVISVDKYLDVLSKKTKYGFKGVVYCLLNLNRYNFFYRVMQHYSENLNQIMLNPFNNMIFIQPNFIPPQLTYFPYLESLQNYSSNQQISSQHLVNPLQQNSSLTRQGPPQSDATRQIGEKKILKRKNCQNEIDEEEEQFTIKLNKTTTNQSITYKKKNTESNIVNQAFSYLSTEKSHKLLERYFKGNTQKMDQYYRVMAKVKQGNKKYINRLYLQRLLAFRPKSQFERAFLKAKPKLLDMADMRRALRVLMYNFLREQVTVGLLTSSKIYKETLAEHFWRKRQIIDSLFNQKDKQF